MRLCVSLFCLLISFAHHCYPDDEGGIRVAEGERARKGDGREYPARSFLFSRRLVVLYGTVHYFSTVYTYIYTAARSSLAYGLFAAVLLFGWRLQL